MSNTKRSYFRAQLIAASWAVQDLLEQIEGVENDLKSSLEDRLAKTKKIREELSKVGMEIDNIKREIRLRY
jgi:hypothetical protein